MQKKNSKEYLKIVHHHLELVTTINYVSSTSVTNIDATHITLMGCSIIRFTVEALVNIFCIQDENDIYEHEINSKNMEIMLIKLGFGLFISVGLVWCLYICFLRRGLLPILTWNPNLTFHNYT